MDNVTQLLGILIRIAGDKEARAKLRALRDGIKGVGKESEKTAKVSLDTGREWQASLDRIRQRYDRIALAIGVVGGALAMLGKKAAYSAGEMELGQLTIQSFVGSAERAKEVYEDLIIFAAKTPVEIKDIMTGTVMLQAFGLASVKTAEGLEKLKEQLLLFGLAAKVMQLPGGVGQVVRSLADLRRGVFEIRQLAAIGISRELLAERGVEFGKSGEILGGYAGFEKSYEAALDILRERFGLLAEEVDKALATRLSNIVDKVELMWMRIGTALKEPIGEVIDALVDYFERLGTAVEKNKDDWLAMARAIAMGVMPVLGPVIALLKSFLYLAENSPGTLKLVAKAIGTVTAALLSLWALQKITLLVAAFSKAWLGLTTVIQAVIYLMRGGAGLNALLLAMPAAINPVVLGISALVAGLGLLVWWMNKTKFSVDDVMKSMDRLAEECETATQEIEQQQKKAEALVGAIDELAKKKDLDREQQTELNKLYAELRVLLPDLPETFADLADEVGGTEQAVSALNTALSTFIEQMREIRNEKLVEMSEQLTKLVAARERLKKVLAWMQEHPTAAIPPMWVTGTLMREGVGRWEADVKAKIAEYDRAIAEWDAKYQAFVLGPSKVTRGETTTTGGLTALPLPGADDLEEEVDLLEKLRQKSFEIFETWQRGMAKVGHEETFGYITGFGATDAAAERLRLTQGAFSQLLDIVVEMEQAGYNVAEIVTEIVPMFAQMVDYLEAATKEWREQALLAGEIGAKATTSVRDKRIEEWFGREYPAAPLTAEQAASKVLPEAGEDIEEGFSALEEALAAGIEGVVRSITSGRIHDLAQTVANSLIRITEKIFTKMMEAGKFGEGMGGLIKGNIVMGLVAGGIEAIAGLFGGGSSEPVHTIVDNWRDFLRKDYETEFAIPGHIGLAGLANTYIDMAGITVNVQQGDASEVARQVGRVTEETVRRGLSPA